MNIEKFAEIVFEETAKFDNMDMIDVEQWPAYREGLQKLIKEVDKAYEVYRMENSEE